MQLIQKFPPSTDMAPASADIRTEDYTLFLGDCLERMNEIPDASVDCVICDPPYFKIVNAEWDNQWKEMKNYTDFILSVAIECKRVMKPNGSLYLFGDDKVIAYIQVELDKHLTLLNSLVWYKTNNQSIKAAPNLRSFAPMTERILFYTPQLCRTGLETIGNSFECYKPIREYFETERKKTNLSFKEINEKCFGTASNGGGMASNILTAYKDGWSFPTKEKYEALQRIGICSREYEDLRREYEDLRREYEDLRRVFNADSGTLDIIKCPIVNSVDNTEHPTTKPLRLIERLVTVSTNKGMTVIDPMFGSGTTGVACLNTGRKFIGIEQSHTYFEIAKKRIEGAQLPLL